MKWSDVPKSPPVIITAPTIEPISVAEAKLHLRVDVSDDDAYISEFLIPSARWQLEHSTCRPPINTVFEFAVDQFPEEPSLPLPRWPLVSVASVTSYDKTNVASLFATSNYEVDTLSEPGRIQLNDGKSWPSDLRRWNAGVIRFTAGYGTTEAAVTTKALWARHAMLYLIGWWYERREPVVVGSIMNQLPLTWGALIAPGAHYPIA